MMQGAILGIRVNSPTVCRAQQWVVLVQTAVMVAAALYVRPFGAPLPNVVLVLSKVSAFVVAVLVLIDDDLQAAAEVVTAVATGIGASEVVITIVILLCSLVPQLARRASHLFRYRGAAPGDKRAAEGRESEGPADVELEALFINTEEGAPQRTADIISASSSAQRSVVGASALRREVVLGGLLQRLVRAADLSRPAGARLQALVEAACYHSLHHRRSTEAAGAQGDAVEQLEQ
jgi:hypothetical protein